MPRAMMEIDKVDYSIGPFEGTSKFFNRCSGLESNDRRSSLLGISKVYHVEGDFSKAPTFEDFLDNYGGTKHSGMMDNIDMSTNSL
jgi:hypothetical protein